MLEIERKSEVEQCNGVGIYDVDFYCDRVECRGNGAGWNAVERGSVTGCDKLNKIFSWEKGISIRFCRFLLEFGVFARTFIRGGIWTSQILVLRYTK